MNEAQADYVVREALRAAGWSPPQSVRAWLPMAPANFSPLEQAAILAAFGRLGLPAKFYEDEDSAGVWVGRPECVRCIAHTHEEKKHLSWCGRDVLTWREWCFQGLDHATYANLEGSRLVVPCPDCVKAAVAALTTSGG